MRVAFIHNEKKIETGAHQINNLMSRKLKSRGVEVVNVYPKLQLVDPPVKLRGLSNILFFYSLLEQRDEILGCDLIQGTTYTPLTFLAFPIPVITHFGSTSYGFLRKTPRAKHLEKMYSDIFKEMKAAEVIGELDLKTRKPIKDIADIETYVAQRADAVIATSEIVKNDLVKSHVPKSNVHVIHNAIEDFWFRDRNSRLAKPGVVFLGRLGNSVFDYKLKGVDRLLAMADEMPDLRFKLIGITQNKKIQPWLFRRYPNIDVSLNLAKLEIKRLLGKQFGNILYITSRYEGFSLSMIEGMSQGLIPIAYPVGVAPEIIKDGTNGFLVESHKQAMVAAKKIMSSAKTRRRMALAAMQTAEKFSTDALADSLLQLYREVLARPRVTKLSRATWVKRSK